MRMTTSDTALAKRHNPLSGRVNFCRTARDGSTSGDFAAKNRFFGLLDRISDRETLP